MIAENILPVFEILNTLTWKGWTFLQIGFGGLKQGTGSYFRSIRIFRQPMLSDSNLETIMLEAYLRADPYDLWGPGVTDTAVPVTVAGLPAFQTTYRVYIGEGGL